MNESSEVITTILVEDHDLTRVGLRTTLQLQPGIKVMGEAVNGMQGLKLLETLHPNVAIVDIGLPDIDGIELTRKFRERQQERQGAEMQESATKILILTMHDSEDSVLAAFAAGADSYCMKDISTDQLAEAIHATHTGNAWIDPAIAHVVLKQMRKASPGSKTSQRTTDIKSIEPEYEQVLEASPLTERELEILELIVSGCSNADISDRLYITVGTVKTHVRNILNKLCADDRTQAAVRALRLGLVT